MKSFTDISFYISLCVVAYFGFSYTALATIPQIYFGIIIGTTLYCLIIITELLSDIKNKLNKKL